MRSVKGYMGDRLKPFTEVEFNRKNRFIITYPEELGLSEWVTFSSTPINFSITYDTISELTSKSYDDLIIEVYDPISPSSAQKVMKFMGDEFQCDNPRQLIYLYRTLDPVGNVTKTWEVTAHIKSVKFGDLEYGSDELMKITLTLGVDRVELRH
jgi:hypothetical protein